MKSLFFLLLCTIGYLAKDTLAKPSEKVSRKHQDPLIRPPEPDYYNYTTTKPPVLLTEPRRPRFKPGYGKNSRVPHGNRASHPHGISSEFLDESGPSTKLVRPRSRRRHRLRPRPSRVPKGRHSGAPHGRNRPPHPHGIPSEFLNDDKDLHNSPSGPPTKQVKPRHRPGKGPNDIPSGLGDGNRPSNPSGGLARPPLPPNDIPSGPGDANRPSNPTGNLDLVRPPLPVLQNDECSDGQRQGYIN